MKSTTLVTIVAGTALFGAGGATVTDLFRHKQASVVEIKRTTPIDLEENVVIEQEADEAITKANEKLRLFPSQIPGAAKVEKYETSGATYCLVHVRQAHLAGEPASWQLNIPEKLEEILKNYKYANSVQKDIYSILQHLIDNANLSEIFAEGITKPISKELAENRYASILDRADTYLVLGENNLQMAKESDAVRYAPGAGLLLTKQGKLQRLPADNEENLEKAEIAALAGLIADKDGKPTQYDPTKDPAIMYHREDALLEIVSKQHQTLAVTTYGGNHNWQDNIGAWNKTHPTKKFSLIVITPVSYGSKEKTSK